MFILIDNHIKGETEWFFHILLYIWKCTYNIIRIRGAGKPSKAAEIFCVKNYMCYLSLINPLTAPFVSIIIPVRCVASAKHTSVQLIWVKVLISVYYSQIWNAKCEATAFKQWLPIRWLSISWGKTYPWHLTKVPSINPLTEHFIFNHHPSLRCV